MGLLFLAYEDRVRWQKWLERPNGANVTNNGTVAVNDWLFGDQKAGVFHVIDRAGNTLIQERREVNQQGCGFTPDGTIAWCSSCGSDNPDLSNKLFVYSVSPPKLLFSTGAVNSMWIANVSTDSDLIVVEDRDGKKTAFTQAGERP